MTPGAFFVSAFISLSPATGLQPLDGWTQFIMPFDTKAECEDFVAMNTLPLMMQMQGSIGSMLETFHHLLEALGKNIISDDSFDEAAKQATTNIKELLN